MCPTPNPGLSPSQDPEQAQFSALPDEWDTGLTSTFSTTCFPKEQTLVETVMVMFSELLYWLLTP